MPRASMVAPGRASSSSSMAAHGSGASSSSASVGFRRFAAGASSSAVTATNSSAGAGAGAGDAAAQEPRAWTPLRDDFFEPPLLSQKEKSYLVRKACEAAQELVERARASGGPISWRHVERANDVQLYAGRPRGSSGTATGSASMCGVTSVPGTVKEVAALFDLTTTQQMKEFAAKHREFFFDAVVLHTLAPRTKEKPLHQVTAKWAAVQTPRGAEDRDFCYLECQDKFIDSLGRKGWVLCMHSIKLPGCDDLSRELGLVRGSFYHSGLVVVEAERPGFVDVIHVVQMNLKNNAVAPPAFLRARVLFAAKVRAMMRAKRLNEQRYLSDLELVPKKYRSRCSVCSDSFSLLLLRKLNCRKCGEVVCGACSKEFEIDSPRFREPVKLRICMRCFQVVTAAPQNAAAVMDTARASTSLSFLGYVDDDQRASIMTEGSMAPDDFGRPTQYQQQQPRPTKIFLQSMRRPSSVSSSMSSAMGNRMPPPSGRYSMDYSHSQMRGPPQGQQQQQYGASRNSERMTDFRMSQSMGASGQNPNAVFTMQNAPRPPPSPASIFDRPAPNSAQRRANNGSTLSNAGVGASAVNGASTANGAGYNNSRNRLLELANREAAMANRDPQQYMGGSTGRPSLNVGSMGYDGSSAAPGSRASTAYRPTYDRMSSPLDVSALRVTEASVVVSPHRERRSSSVSSESSTGSIDIDAESYDVDGNTRPPETSAPSPASRSANSPSSRTQSSRDDDDDSNDSFDPMVAFRSKEPFPLVPSRSRREGDDEETKADEFAKTPALPPPSPSAHVATHEILTRESTVGRPSVKYTAPLEFNDDDEEDFIDHDGPDSDSEGEDRVDSNLNAPRRPPLPMSSTTAVDDNDSILNTAGCDMSYLDADMRQFHDESLFVRNGEGSERNPGSVTTRSYAPSSVTSGTSNGDLAQYQSTAPFLSSEAYPTSPTRTSERGFYGKPPRQSGVHSSSVRSDRRPPVAREGTFALPGNLASPAGSDQHLQRSGWNSTPSPDNSIGSLPRTAGAPAPLSYTEVSATPTDARFLINGSLVSVAAPSQYEDEDLSYRRPEHRQSTSSDNSSRSSDNSSRSGGQSSTSAGESTSPPRAKTGIGANVTPDRRHSPASQDVPAYLPARFHTPTRTDTTADSRVGSSATASTSSSSGAAPPVEQLDTLTLDLSSSSSFESNQTRNDRTGSDPVQHVQFRAPAGSLLDAVPESGGVGAAAPPRTTQFVAFTDDTSASDSASGSESDSDEDQLLSARDLFQSFGDTGKLASLAGGNARAQRTFSQLQLNLARAGDSSDEEE